MIPDSMNPRQMAENILELQRQIKEAGSELPTPGAGDTGKILKVGSDGYELATEYSYTPPAFSSTNEVNTGEKWIDGRDVYMKAFSGTTPLEDSTLTVGSIESGSVVIDMRFIVTNTSGTYHLYAPTDIFPRVSSVGSIAISKSATASYQGTPFTFTVKYVKPAPTPDVVPSPDNYTRSVEPIEEVTEEPVQETKTTRKRSTSSK